MTTIEKGWLFLAVGLFAVSLQESCEVLGLGADHADFISGLCAGLATNMFGAAIYFLAKSTHSSS